MGVNFSALLGGPSRSLARGADIRLTERLRKEQADAELERQRLLRDEDDARRKENSLQSFLRQLALSSASRGDELTPESLSGLSPELVDPLISASESSRERQKEAEKRSLMDQVGVFAAANPTPAVLDLSSKAEGMSAEELSKELQRVQVGTTLESEREEGVEDLFKLGQENDMSLEQLMLVDDKKVLDSDDMARYSTIHRMNQRSAAEAAGKKRNEEEFKMGMSLAQDGQATDEWLNTTTLREDQRAAIQSMTPEGVALKPSELGTILSQSAKDVDDGVSRFLSQDTQDKVAKREIPRHQAVTMEANHRIRQQYPEVWDNALETGVPPARDSQGMQDFYRDIGTTESISELRRIEMLAMDRPKALLMGLNPDQLKRWVEDRAMSGLPAETAEADVTTSTIPNRFKSWVADFARKEKKVYGEVLSLVVDIYNSQGPEAAEVYLRVGPEKPRELHQSRRP